jgi:N-acyl homoserine lactone hydrolase
VKRIIGLAAMLLSGLLSVAAGHAQFGVERLYTLNCGEGVVGDISRCRPA